MIDAVADIVIWKKNQLHIQKKLHERIINSFHLPKYQR